MNNLSYFLKPKKLTTALNFLHTHHKVIILNGGSSFNTQKLRQLAKEQYAFLDISHVSEFNTLLHEHSNLIIGSHVSFSRIYQHPSCPKILKKMLLSNGPLYIHNLATLGGGLGLYPHSETLFLLNLLNASIEIHSEKKYYLYTPSERISFFLPKEHLISRILIPLERWDHEFYYKEGNPYFHQNHYIVATLIKKSGDSIIKFIFYFFINYKQYQIDLSSILRLRSIQLHRKEINELTNYIHKTFSYKHSLKLDEMKFILRSCNFFLNIVSCS